MELALGRLSPTGSASVLFTPHLVPMTRGILATCYARPTAEAAALGTDGLLAHYRDFYAGEPFVAVLDQPPATKATAGSNAVHVTVRYDGRTNTVLAISAEDNLVKGASGQALQNANLLLGLPETLGLPDRRSGALMSVTAATGFVAAGVRAGIKASGRPDLSLVATADHRPVTAAGVFTTNLVAAAPVQLSRRHLAAEGQAAAVVLNSGNANAATGEPGLLVAERPPDWWPTRSDASAATSSSARPGSSGSRCRSTPSPPASRPPPPPWPPPSKRGTRRPKPS